MIFSRAIDRMKLFPDMVNQEFCEYLCGIPKPVRLQVFHFKNFWIHTESSTFGFEEPSLLVWPFSRNRNLFLFSRTARCKSKASPEVEFKQKLELSTDQKTHFKSMYFPFESSLHQSQMILFERLYREMISEMIIYAYRKRRYL